jgi:hypothetical protein
MNNFDILAAKLAVLFFISSLLPSIILGVALALLLFLAICASLGMHALEHTIEVLKDEEEDNTPSQMSFLMAGWRRVYDYRVLAAIDLSTASQAMRAIETEVTARYSGKEYVFGDGLRVSIRERYFIVTPPQA